MDCSPEETSGRRSSDCSSPEFEFCPSVPGSDMLTADELFADGVLLPLHLLSVSDSSKTTKMNFSNGKVNEEEEQEEEEEEGGHRKYESASILTVSSSPSASKRWMDIFKMGGRQEEKASKDKKSNSSVVVGGGVRGGGVTELNINLWPFSRSRSAGTAARPRAAVAARKSSSAPCSRSNSRGEAGRRWAASPGRGGVPVGRPSPVWQFKKLPGKITEPKEKTHGGGAKKVGKGLNLNVNTCIGYRSQVSCRDDDKDPLTDGDRIRGDGGASNGSLFSLKTLFSKKVH